MDVWLQYKFELNRSYAVEQKHKQVVDSYSFRLGEWISGKKTPHKAVYVMRKVKFKQENNNDKRSTQKQNKNGGDEQDKLNETSFAQTQKHEESAIAVVQECIC